MRWNCGIPGVGFNPCPYHLFNTCLLFHRYDGTVLFYFGPNYAGLTCLFGNSAAAAHLITMIKKCDES